MQMNDAQAREVRSLRRQFIRAHHPDRGGDVDFFMAGLRAFDTGRVQGAGQLPRVVIVKRGPWLIRFGLTTARRIRYGPRPPRVR